MPSRRVFQSSMLLGANSWQNVVHPDIGLDVDHAVLFDRHVDGGQCIGNLDEPRLGQWHPPPLPPLTESAGNVIDTGRTLSSVMWGMMPCRTDRAGRPFGRRHANGGRRSWGAVIRLSRRDDVPELLSTRAAVLGSLTHRMGSGRKTLSVCPWFV